MTIPFKQRTRIRIGTVAAVRGEMSRVYKAGVSGELPWQDCTRAVYCLVAIARLDADELIEGRLAALEGLLEPQQSRGNGSGSYARP